MLFTGVEESTSEESKSLPVFLPLDCLCNEANHTAVYPTPMSAELCSDQLRACRSGSPPELHLVCWLEVSASTYANLPSYMAVRPLRTTGMVSRYWSEGTTTKAASMAKSSGQSVLKVTGTLGHNFVGPRCLQGCYHPQRGAGCSSSSHLPYWQT